MNKIKSRASRIARYSFYITKSSSVLCLLAAMLLPSVLMAQDLAVKAERLYTGTGEVIENGVVIISDGKILKVGRSEALSIDAGIEVIEVAVATPGLIDARSVVGLSGAMNQRHDQDQLERSAAIQPELRAIDAYNPRELLVEWLREHGVTTVHTGHGPGEVVSGQTLIAKTWGTTVEQAVIDPSFALSATLGPAATRHDRKTPGNRSKAVAMLRTELQKAREYQAKLDSDADQPRDLGLEALAAVLNQEMPLIIEVHRHHDIMTALRLAEEFEFTLILAGASEAYLLIDEILAAKVSVIIHPTMLRARGGSDVQHFSFTTAAKLVEAGIPVALQSGFEAYVPKTRVVLFEAAMTLAHGLSFDQALNLITMAPAKMLGIDDRVGSLEPGKDADIAMFDGDPFEYTTKVVGTIINGERVSSTLR
ncbi:amidohydrolase family protein [Glaciecola sp. SC05]|uniref:amidohydrolase family protein n=1 Tax=Glaciecola sp. SC05 TaxID=1987355 RepID=UPI00352874A2